MDESKILSVEEVDALLKAAHDKESDFSKIISNIGRPKPNEFSINYKAVSHIVELTWAECEKVLASFIRKKVHVKPKESKFGKLSECLDGKLEKHVFALFHIKTTNDYCLVVIDLPFLHQMINALYGGRIDETEEMIESTGNIGIIIAEKICELILSSFCTAAKEYGSLAFKSAKTVTMANIIGKIAMDDNMYSLGYTASIGTVESEINFIFPIDFLHKFLPANNITDEEHMKYNCVWREAIKSQVIDSDVTIIASLPEIDIKAKDLISLKNGDLIPIGDPTLVEVYLNGVKLFSSIAGQANSTRIIKIVDEY